MEKELKIKNRANNKIKRLYKISVVFEDTYYNEETKLMYARYQQPIKLAETYSPGTAYVIAQAMQKLYKTMYHADYIEIA